MSWLTNFLSSLSPAKSTFLFCTALGVSTAVMIGLVGGPGGSNLVYLLIAFATWIVLGLLFGGIAWVIDTLSIWRTSLTMLSSDERDPAVDALRDRYARGEIDENQFDKMLRRLNEV